MFRFRGAGGANARATRESRRVLSFAQSSRATDIAEVLGKCRRQKKCLLCILSPSEGDGNELVLANRALACQDKLLWFSGTHTTKRTTSARMRRAGKGAGTRRGQSRIAGDFPRAIRETMEGHIVINHDEDRTQDRNVFSKAHFFPETASLPGGSGLSVWAKLEVYDCRLFSEVCPHKPRR